MHILGVAVGSSRVAARRPRVFDAIDSFSLGTDEISGLSVAPVALGEEELAGWPDRVQEFIVPGSDYTDPRVVAQLTSVIERLEPDLVVLLADERGSALAPLIAAALGWGILPDAVRVDGDGETVRVVRTMQRGAAEATLRATTTRAVISVHPAALDSQARNVEYRLRDAAGAHAVIEAIDVAAPPAWAAVGGGPEARVPVVEADVVLGIGRGVTSDAQMEAVDRLARILGATVAASRQAIENGRAAAAVKVGDTGLKLGAALYLAVGISGANQHVSGVESCLSVVAVNKDRRAPIFAIASAGAVGDMTELLPELCDALEARLA